MMAKLEAPEGVGALLRALRQQKRMTQEMLATLTGVSTQTISNIETQNTNYSIAVLCKLSDVLEFSTEILLGRAPAQHRELNLEECARILRENGDCIAHWMERDGTPPALRSMLSQYQAAVEQLFDYVSQTR